MRKTEYALVRVTGIYFATKRPRVRQALRERGWSLVVAGLFFALLAGQTLAEFL